MPLDDAVAAEIRALRETIERMRQDWREQSAGYVARDFFDARLASLDGYIQALGERVRKMEDRSEWLVRTIGGIIIAAVLALVLVVGKGGGA